MNEQYLKLKNYLFLHFLIIGLLAINIVMRVYTIYFVDKDRVVSEATQTGYLIGMILLVVILLQLIFKPSIGYLLSVLILSDTIFGLLSHGVSKSDLLHISNAIAVTIIFAASLFIWWKVYDFSPFKKMFQKIKLPKN